MTAATPTLEITRPDDWHLHLRDGEAMHSVVGATAAVFARAIVMPNLKPPITTTDDALAYRERIMAALPPGTDFEPLMTLYLTEATSVEELAKAKTSGMIHAVKYYPAGATTNSQLGVSAIAKAYPALEALQNQDMPLLIHGEVTDGDVDIFDREKIFIEQTLQKIIRDFPSLRIVLEHITTREAAEFVREAPAHIAATITPQHLLYNRNAILVGGIRPHFYCLPILKREEHRLALVQAATSGNPKFFLGTDSAPHATSTKETACGCAGCYSAPIALPLYATAFEAANALDRLEAFASFYGSDFYRLPRNQSRIILERSPWQIPENLPLGTSTITPLSAGETLAWRVRDSADAATR